MLPTGTGVLLNNELDDFAAKANAPNAYGLLGDAANAPAPGKRPLSSMTPTIVLKDGKPFLVTGSPGGSFIINVVLQIVSNVIDRGMNIASAVTAPRVHDQWMPDRVLAEPTLPPDLVAALQARGDNVVVRPLITSANSILVTQAGITGAADPRTRGALAAGIDGAVTTAALRNEHQKYERGEHHEMHQAGQNIGAPGAECEQTKKKRQRQQ